MQPVVKNVFGAAESQPSMTTVGEKSELGLAIDVVRDSSRGSAVREPADVAQQGQRQVLRRRHRCVRSPLMAGSMSWFGNAIVSQCEIDEPGWTGLGALEERAAQRVRAGPDREVDAERHVDARRRGSPLSVLRVGLRDPHRRDRDRRIGAAEPRRRAARGVVRDDDRDRARVLGVLHLDRRSRTCRGRRARSCPATAAAFVSGAQASSLGAAHRRRRAPDDGPVTPSGDERGPKAAVPTV